MEGIFLGSCIICTCYTFLYLTLYPVDYYRALMFRDCTSAYDIFINVSCWIFLTGSVVALILVLG